eukprot:TRINITY_DN36187_c0_g1_i1.p2 TRINITY_DN36187_c0_g1~~TRINITY_DN36187_c0_g1_i1.p2  ORF type:complete len:274 (-),score=77.16 TRINITY_DN36187_c0_g1_i1:48-869(-)
MNVFCCIYLALLPAAWGFVTPQLSLRAKALQTQVNETETSTKHVIYMCNAYPSEQSLKIYRGKQVLTNDTSLKYKSCREFTFLDLKEGEKLTFEESEATANIFELVDLPRQQEALMAIIATRKASSSTDLTFESLVFKEPSKEHAQLAVIDVHDGKAQADLRITHSDVNSRGEQMTWGRITSVNSGHYRLWLEDAEQSLQAETDFTVLGGNSYVVMRVGGDAHPSSHGLNFPQDLVVFPKSTEEELEALQKSSSPSPALAVPLVCLLVLRAVA